MKKTEVKKKATRPIRTIFHGLRTVDHILRNRDSTSGLVAVQNENPIASVPLRQVMVIVLLCGSIYGAAMGSYAFAVGKREFAAQIPQLIYSAIKVPLLVCFTVAISLPSFFVINTLLGLRDDFGRSLRAIISAQAGLAVILASLFPITLFVYVSLSGNDSSYPFAILFNAAMFALASISAQTLLRAYYNDLINENSRHRWMVRMWIVVYAFVGIQAGYVLRPFIGSPAMDPSFLRKESFQNAYVKVWSLCCEVIESAM